MKQLRLLFVFLLSFLSASCFGQLISFAEQPVILHTANGEIKGKLLLPAVQGRCPVVLLIAGSGPTDMDGNSAIGQMKNNSLKFLAEDLAREGIASLRFDKRGIASSAVAGQDESSMRFENFIDDVKGWIDWLSKNPRLGNITVVGHSEGSLIGMAACRNNPKAKAFVSLAGAGQPLYDVLEKQMASQPESLRKQITAINDSLKNGKMVTKIPYGLEPLFRKSVQPFLISLYQYNPQQIIGTLKIPVYIIQGKNDIQISVDDAELLKKAAPSAEWLLIEKMNHVLKDCESTDPQKQMAVYTDPSLDLSDGLVSSISAFIKKLK